MNVKWPFETFVNLQIPNRSACDGSWFGHSWKGYTCSQRGCPANWGYICSITTIFCNFWHPPFLKEWSSGEVLLCRNGFRSESGGVCPHGWMSGESKSVIAQQGVCKCPPPPGTHPRADMIFVQSLYCQISRPKIVHRAHEEKATFTY